ncbi:hypothetical protein BHE74_00004133 [Ensete ventricosum]|nr:hypothetical protein GW17_00031967 [Ensete ventricosum]RWW87061.1 hypothetical protein BHE74_00004133 [Ensete ventricosum]
MYGEFHLPYPEVAVGDGGGGRRGRRKGEAESGLKHRAIVSIRHVSSLPEPRGTPSPPRALPNLPYHVAWRSADSLKTASSPLRRLPHLPI